LSADSSVCDMPCATKKSCVMVTMSLISDTQEMFCKALWGMFRMHLPH
jgi:hypothetical protein